MLLWRSARVELRGWGWGWGCEAGGWGRLAHLGTIFNWFLLNPAVNLLTLAAPAPAKSLAEVQGLDDSGKCL